MPNIPDFAANNKLPNLRPGGAAEQSPGAMAMAGEAGVRLGQAQAAAGEEVGDAMSAFNQRYTQMAQASAASHLSAQGSEALGDLQHKWSLHPNRAEAEAGFDSDAAAQRKQLLGGIIDPAVQATVGRDFDSEAIARRYDTANSAFRLEGSAKVAQLNDDLNGMANSGAGATNGVLQGQLIAKGTGAIDQAVGTGLLDPETGEKMKLNYRSQIQEVRARGMMNDAIDKQDGTAAAAVASMLDDPQQFAGLLPERREVLQTRLENLSFRLDQRAASQQAHQDAVAEKNLHQGQAHNEAVLLAGIDGGTVNLSDSELQHLADSQQITAGGVEAIVAARKRAQDGQDAPKPTLQLWHAIGTKQATPDMIYSAMGSGQVSRATAVDMMKAIDSGANQQDNKATTAAFNQLKTALHGGAIDQGIVPDKAPEVAAWAQAQGEWNRRVTTGGEDAATVLPDMLKRYGNNTASPTWLDKPVLGTVSSPQDVASVIQKTAQAFRAGKMGQSQYDAQLKLLSQYKNYYGLPATKPPAKAGAQP